jgi:hypothetical protein
VPPAVFGDFLDAAREHLEAALVIDGEVPLPATARDLRRLVEIMSHYAEDLAPCDVIEAGSRDDLSPWERAIIDVGEALGMADGHLARAAAEIGDLAGTTIPAGASHLSAAAASLAAGRDLLHTHFGIDPVGLTLELTEWAPVVTSMPVTRALATEIARFSDQLAPFTAWLAARSVPLETRHASDRARHALARDDLANASRWLQVAAAVVRPALDAGPVRAADKELLDAIPPAAVPQRLRPGNGGETLAELCHGITVSASRLRAAVRGSADRARWSPGVTSGGWQWMAQAAKVTSHLSELALQSLATSVPQLGDVLRGGADAMAGMRAGWKLVDQMWHAVVTETRLLPTPAMTEASDLILRMGRLVWDNPRWTPAHAGGAARMNPALLAPDVATVTAVVSAAHHAIDALALVAVADMDAVDAAERAGRLYVPTRSLPDDYDVPRAFATAPVDRCQALREAYHAAIRASQQAAQALDSLAIAAGTPSKTLALARAATPTQSRRRGHRTRHEDGNPRDTRCADAAVGRPGPVEQAVRDLRVSDPVVLLRAAAIDKAARNLITEAESTTVPPETPPTAGNARDPAASAVRLATQSFPHAKPQEGIGHDVQPVQPSSQIAARSRRPSPGRPLARRRTS